MSEKEMKAEGLENQDRRKAIKKIAVGAAALAGYSVLPQRWTTPVIDVMALPAHAQTSGPVGAPIKYQINQLRLRVLSGDQGSSVVTVSIEGRVNPPVAGQSIEIVFIAKPHCGKKKIKTRTKADGRFKIKRNLSCGPGVVQVVVYIIIIGINMQRITEYINIPPAVTPTAGTTSKPGKSK